jgi:hypothetical protein
MKGGGGVQMIMDNEYDMWRYSACDHAGNETGSGLGELMPMTALQASPSLLRFVR